jgi:hypothetical protein
MLLAASALLMLGGELRAQDDSLAKIQKEFSAAYRKAGRAGLDKKEVAGFLDRFVDFATDHKGEETAFEAYGFTLQILGMAEEPKQVEVFTEVMDALIEGWLNDDKMAGIAYGPLANSGGALEKKAHEYFDWVAKDSKSTAVQAACAAVKLNREAAATIDVAKSKALVAKYQELKKKVGDAQGPYGQSWAEMFDETIAGLELAGTPAKEIAGPDLDGVAFKLSDYKGKAVLLDFWGYW